MAMMQVILTQDVEHVGRAGELVKVKPGYGRNFLLPRGLALVATRGNVAQLEHHRKAIEAEQAKMRAEYQRLAGEIEKASVSVARKAGEENKLFGSVTSKDIAEALSAQKIAVDRKLIQLPEPIKAAGDYEVTVRFSADVKAVLKVKVIGLAK